MIRVQIFEDNLSRRDALEMLINSSSDLELAGSSSNCNSVLDDIKNADADVILMDIEMPGLNGIQATSVIKHQFPEKQIIIQTVFDDSDRIFEAIKAGASGYLLKSISAVDIIQAVRDAASGGSPMSPAIAAKVLAYYRETMNTAKTQVNDHNLSERELEVLLHLVDGLSYKMIADRLSISYNTVNTHVKNIYEKLHVHSVAEAVNTAYKSGLVNR